MIDQILFGSPAFTQCRPRDGYFVIARPAFCNDVPNRFRHLQQLHRHLAM